MSAKHDLALNLRHARETGDGWTLTRELVNQGTTSYSQTILVLGQMVRHEIVERRKVKTQVAWRITDYGLDQLKAVGL